MYFTAVDDHVKEVSRRWYKSVKKLVKHLMEVFYHVTEYQERKDLVTVRAIFVWIYQNMRWSFKHIGTDIDFTDFTFARYDPAFLEHQLTTLDILRYRAGVCQEFVKIFMEMCQSAEVPVKIVQGFAKGHNYKPGRLLSYIKALSGNFAIRKSPK